MVVEYFYIVVLVMVVFFVFVVVWYWFFGLLVIYFVDYVFFKFEDECKMMSEWFLEFVLVLGFFIE